MEPTTNTPIAALAAAIVAAQTSARAVAKAARNEFHRYAYASAEGIIAEAREALSGAGLALLTLEWHLIPSEDAPPVTDAKAVPIGRIAVAYRLVHTSGEFLNLAASTPVIPEKGRPADKAEFAAITANLAYMLRGLLLLPRDDEQAAIDARDDRGHDPTEPARRAPPSPPSEPAPIVVSIERIADMIRNRGSLAEVDALAREVGRTVPAGHPLRTEVGALFAARRAELEPPAATDPAEPMRQPGED